MRIRALAIAAFALLPALSGCGYTLQGTRNEMLEREGIRTIYVAPLGNDTFKPGVENLVYNELIRTIAEHGRVRIVDRAEKADAVLKGTVSGAGYSASATTTADRIITNGYAQPGASANQPVASEYQANLSVTFSLDRTHPGPGQGTTLWTSNFSRAKVFPASNQLGPYGTTNALINESEFDRALGEIARNMMADLHESMLAMF
jgi:hypothetical protein